ncbi:MAG: hypothetical protein ACKO8K_01510, partial [Candidatus Limnocylindrus sp.]
ELWPRVERAVILRSIDQLWVEHLTEVDDLRRGIGLRGHAQIDPLNAFKIDGEADTRKRDVSTRVLNVNVSQGNNRTIGERFRRSANVHVP